MAPIFHRDAETCAEAVLSTIGRDIALALGVGNGKPIHLANALYQRAVNDPSIKLKIFTGLTFLKPGAGAGLERRFAGPLIDRIFAGFPAPDYIEALKRGKLPANIKVYEFFFQAGVFLNAPLAQQTYTSLNYTHVANFLQSQGVNVVGQIVAKRGEGEGARFSAGSNTDIALDILPALLEKRKGGGKLAIIGQVNSAMPFMEGAAEAQSGTFDHIIEGPEVEFPLFAPPRSPVALHEHGAAIHAAALVKDGGTIQLGIGAFADALSYALVLRQKHNGRFGALARALGAGRLHPSLPVETGAFAKGLYASTELFGDGYMELYREGILKRRAFEDVETQAKADAGELSAGEYAKGVVMHAGFFFGSNALYKALRELGGEVQRDIRMCGISFPNTLFGNEALKRAQRRHARFINSAMMVTLLGAVVCDQLEDGRVVSGIGGQYNFVAQAHELEDGRSIIALPATRMASGRAQSNIRWTYGHVSVPRHLRDIVVTEYGAADTRGLSDRDTIAAMLNIADSRFQESLLAEAKTARKIERGYEIPFGFRANTPEQIESLLGPARAEGILPLFPFGTDMTAEEIALVPALTRLKHASGSIVELAQLALRGTPWAEPAAAEKPLLRRLGLEAPQSPRERLEAALVLGALRPR
jgi:acyl-CoA hydrolase